jgi:hypothetical protein
MKKIVIFFLIINLSVFGNAQKQITDVTLSYDILINRVNQEKNTSNSPSATYRLYVKGALTKSEFINSLGTETTIFNSKTETGVILKEYSGQKLLVNLNKQDWLFQNHLFMKLDFKFSSQLKKIEGKEYQTATAALQDGGKLTVYFDASLNIVNNNYSIAFPGIKGLPIQFENLTNGINYVYKLKEINYDIVSQNSFDIPSSGYRVINYKDAMGLKKEN